MKKIISLIIFCLIASTSSWAQSTPGFYQGQVPTPAQWNSYFAAKQDVLGFTPLNIAGGQLSGPLGVITPQGITSVVGGLTLAFDQGQTINLANVVGFKLDCSADMSSMFTTVLAETNLTQLTAPPGSCIKFSSDTVWKAGVTYLMNGVTVNCATAPTSGPCIDIAGSEGSAVLLTANAAQGATSLSVASTAGVVQGSVIRVYSNDVWAVNSGNTYTDGFLESVESVSTGTIVVTSALPVAITTANAASYTLENLAPQTTIQGLILVGNFAGTGGAQQGIECDYCLNPRFEDLVISGFDSNGIELLRDWHGIISGSNISDEYQTGVAYCIVNGSGSRFTEILHNTCLRARQLMDNGGNHLDFVWDTKIIGNFVTCRQYCIDSHPNALDVVISENTTDSDPTSVNDNRGIFWLGAGKVVISDNQIKNGIRAGVFIENDIEAAVGESVEITGNDISCAAAANFSLLSTQTGIFISSEDTGNNGTSVIITGNKIGPCGDTATSIAGYGIQVSGGTGGTPINSLVVTGNETTGPEITTDIAVTTATGNQIKGFQSSGNIWIAGPNATEVYNVKALSPGDISNVNIGPDMMTAPSGAFYYQLVDTNLSTVNCGQNSGATTAFNRAGDTNTTLLPSCIGGLPSAQILVGNASNFATPVALSGDASIANTGAITVSKTGGTAFGSFATGTSAANLTGSIPSSVLTTALASPPAIGGTAPAAGKFTSLTLTNLVSSTTAPSIASGFGSGATIPTNNGTQSFTINVGAASASGVLTMPTAANGWNCSFTDQTTVSAAVSTTRETATSVSSVTLGNYNDLSASGNWTANDIIHAQCSAY